MDAQAKLRFLERTWGHLSKVWRKSEREQSSVQLQPDLPDEDIQLLRDQIQLCIKSRGCEALARAETAALGRCYLELSSEGRARFLKVLATDFDIDSNQIDLAIDDWQMSMDSPDRYANAQKLHQALAAPRVQLLTQFNELPEGVKFLVDMRDELLNLIGDDAALAALEGDIKKLLVSWFDIGFLKLERITWDSPASLLEKLIAYEAVHEIRSWDDLKNRLDSDRRCYAFLHPHMPGEPLIFVEVALINGLASNVQSLLDETAPVQNLEQADTAIFYSISNAQPGLVGISFGNFLIKQVVAKLSQEFPGLKHFATLSPIVNFRRWLIRQLANDNDDKVELLTQAERKELSRLCGLLDIEDNISHLLELPNWFDNAQACEALQPILTCLAARYLSEEKRDGQRAFDPVAHFHLTNGAQIEQLNWMADQSEKGIQQSFGLMVNYLYQLDGIESNSIAYTERGEAISSNAIKALLKK